jgi:hypothetical protein
MSGWESAARRAARKYGLPENYFTRQMGQEAHGQDLTSPAGAQGPAQIMPDTARGWGLSPSQVHQIDPAYDAAAKHMAEYVKQFGSFRNALVAYNAGPGRVGGTLPAETRNYISTIMRGGGGPQSTPAAPAASNFNVGGSQTPAPPQVNPFSIIAGLGQQPVGPQQQENPYAAIMQRGWDLLGKIWEQKYGGQQQAAGGTPSLSQIGGFPDSGGGGGGGKNLPTGTAKFDGKTVAAWIKPALEYARQQGWKGSVNSGFRTDAEQKRIYDSGVRPAAKPRAYGGGGSNHEGAEFPAGAVDVSEAQQLSDILRNSPWRKKLVYAGAKDPVHFSHPHNGSY